MILEYDLTVEDLLEFYQQSASPSVTATVRRAGWLLVVAGVVFIAAAAVIFALMGTRSPAIVGALLPFGITSILLARTVFNARPSRLKRSMDPQTREKLMSIPAWKEAPVGLHRLEADARGLVDSYGDISTAVGWPAVRSVRETELLILIAFGPSTIILPKRALGANVASIMAELNDLWATATPAATP